jgi:hypothetical protein
VWAFYWPGDHSSGVFRILGAANVYSTRRDGAIISGQSLGELIMRLSPQQKVTLVAHSMGCRVLLEALAHCSKEQRKGRSGAQIVAACLMAAAVPTTECEGPEEDYRLRPGEPRELVLFSSNDEVLRPGFRIGEWLYDSKEGPAVGATGLPDGRWSVGSIDTTLGHTRYWKDRRSVNLVDKFLSGGPINEIMSRAGPEERTWQQPRRDQVAREVSTRDVGDGDVLEWQNCFDPP